MKKAIVTVKYPILGSDRFTVKKYDDGDLIVVIRSKVECVIAIEESNSKKEELLKPLPSMIEKMFIPVSNISSIIFNRI